MNKQILLLLIVLAGLAQFACRKDNGDSGTPTITNIRVVDSTKRDSSFTAALPGTMIVIQGHNLGGLQSVYFNDTAAYFNPVYTTSTNIIVTIPTTAPTKAADPNVQNVIKVVTDHGTATYSFELYLEPPVINSIALDNSGTMVTINGSNFQGVQKITFPVPGADTALSYTVNKEFTQIVAAIPPGTPATDSIRVYATYGVAAFAYPPPMIVTSISNENGAPGDTITINGTNFIGIQQVTFPGGVTSTDITPVSVNEFQVTVPQGLSTAGNLTLSGVLGTTQAPLPYATYITHPLPGYLATFDNQYSSDSLDNSGFVGWTGGYADKSTANATYRGATGGVGVLQQSSPMPAKQGAGSQGNAGFIQLNPYPWVANSNTSINGYALKFELYVVTPWNAGDIWITTGDWYKWQDLKNDNGSIKNYNYTARFAPWETAPGNVYKPNGWVTITIPLTQFITDNQFYQTAWNSNGSPAKKFSDYVSSFSNTQATALCFMIMNDDQTKAVPAGSINVAIDNVRIVKVQ